MTTRSKALPYIDMPYSSVYENLDGIYGRHNENFCNPKKYSLMSLREGGYKAFIKGGCKMTK